MLDEECKYRKGVYKVQKPLNSLRGVLSIRQIISYSVNYNIT
jgi:hypothetical protein